MAKEIKKQYYTKNNRANDRFLATVYVSEKNITVEYRVVHKKRRIKETTSVVRYRNINDMYHSIAEYYRLNGVRSSKIGQSKWVPNA